MGAKLPTPPGMPPGVSKNLNRLHEMGWDAIHLAQTFKKVIKWEIEDTYPFDVLLRIKNREMSYSPETESAPSKNTAESDQISGKQTQNSLFLGSLEHFVSVDGKELADFGEMREECYAG